MTLGIVIALALAVVALRRVRTLERTVRELRGETETLRARVAQLGALPHPGGTGRAMPSADATAEPEPLVPQLLGPDVPVDAAESTAPGSTPTVVIGTGSVDPGPVDHGLVRPGVVDPALADAASTEPRPSEAGPSAPELWPAPATAAAAESLETRIGSRWLLYIGVSAIVLGVGYFVKYAFDNQWIAPLTRVALGVAAGLGLVAAGHQFIRRGLLRYGQALTGGGVGTFYLAIVAAYQWYGIVGRPLTFASMVATTLFGVWLADRQRSQLLALFAVSIGFLTPFVIGGDDPAQVTLFTYDLVLVAGTVLLARRRDWPALNIVAFLLTASTISAWCERYYQRSDHLTTELFLTAFLVLFLWVLRLQRRWTSPVATLGTALIGSSPVLYHLASLAVLGPHRGPLLVYFIAFSVAGVIAAQHLRNAWLRLAIWVGVAVPFLGFASTRLPRGWQVAAWVTLSAIYGLHIIAQAQSLDEERTVVRAPEVVLLHANGLWVLLALWLLLAPRALDRLTPIAFGLAGLYALMAVAGRWWHRDAALHAVALAAALGAAAVAIRFSGPWIAVALGAEGAALVWLGLRENRHWLRHAGSLFLTAAVALLLVLMVRPLSLSSLPFFNTRAAAAVLVIGLLHLASRLSRGFAAPPGSLWFAVARLTIVANVLTLLFLSTEVSAYFGWSAWAGRRLRGAGAFTSAELARQLALSIVWAAYAVVLVAVGLRVGNRPIRILAIVIFAITIAKVFLIDLAALDRFYRMLSVIGLGVLLLMASYLYQRLHTPPAPPSRPATPLEEPGQ